MQETLNSLHEMSQGFLRQLPQIALGLIVLFLTWLASRFTAYLIHKFFLRFHFRKSVAELLLNLISTSIWIAGILLAVIIVFPTVTPGNALTALGLGSIAIGFAFKDIIENFLAGILILLREPFKLGDFIECKDIEGFVEVINIRETYIRQVDGQRVVMPNAQLLTEPVTVRTDQPVRRITVTCGVAYGEDVDQSREVIYNAVKELKTIDPKHDVEIFAHQFGESSVDFEVTWWTSSLPLEIRRSKDEVIAAVKRALDEAGIEIPFPYRTLIWKEPLQVLPKDTSSYCNLERKE